MIGAILNSLMPFSTQILHYTGVNSFQNTMSQHQRPSRMLTDENLLDLWDEKSQRAIFPFFSPFTAEIRRAPTTRVQHGKQSLDIDIQGCGKGKGRATTVRRGEAGTCPHGQIELNVHTCMCDCMPHSESCAWRFPNRRRMGRAKRPQP